MNFGEWHFVALAETYPHARFIYTHRNLESWLTSCRRFYRPRRIKRHQRNYHIDIFGTRGCYSERAFRNTYLLHEAAVRSQFQNDDGSWDDRCLYLETERLGWDPLCQFLGVPVPDEPFPHENRRR